MDTVHYGFSGTETRKGVWTLTVYIANGKKKTFTDVTEKNIGELDDWARANGGTYKTQPWIARGLYNAAIAEKNEA